MVLASSLVLCCAICCPGGSGGRNDVGKLNLLILGKIGGVSRELFFLDQQEIILNRNKLVDPARFGKEESV